ncbi:[protein-PII] uridylyltransferase [Actinomadura logoneensis]|uniref:Bifunctional uridylyltransferase/uridylyl-removing enzyme n=1 Tax=Actinomadura logoneensis TaxID=2293572 RepID=A0A372JIL6_9ACTN|nr:[protein-PII] uridylyltransferase [Actinomadura logoneensis]RFU39857.1 [protein-PII] uridylyltransferase [Actinomadura logoneensis]
MPSVAHGDGAGPGGRARAVLSAARAARAAELDGRLTALFTAAASPPLPDGRAVAPGSPIPADAALVSADAALVAVGSHARRELTPGGDLDLVLLHRGRPDVAEIADRIWYPIWDAGLRLDHSVRTADEARAVARDDMKAALGLVRTADEARAVARDDMKAALGLLAPRLIAGDRTLVEEVRTAVLADWRADAPRRLAELGALSRERWDAHGELAFLLEGDLKEARGGLRDVQVMRAVAASWVAAAPDGRIRAANDLLLDVRHALHATTGRTSDRLVLQEQEAVAAALGLLDADVLLRAVAEAARMITHADDQLWRRVDRFVRRRTGPTGRRGSRRPVGDGAVEQDGEVVLARNADLDDPALVLRVAAAAAQNGLPLAPATVDTLAGKAALPGAPWPPAARDALVSLLGAGPAAIAVWEALDQAGLVVRLLPDWERVRNRPQRNPVHRFTVDRHLVETAAGAAALTREVARPDLLLAAALLHDIGKGWPGDHSVSGAVVARDAAARMGFPADDAKVLETVVRRHLLLPETATRRDLDDPRTIETVLEAVAVPGVPGRERDVLELLAALAVADGQATGPGAWGSWKARLVADLAQRALTSLAGGTLPPAPALGPETLALARHDGAAVRVQGTRVTITAPDRPGLLWRAAGVLALHRLAVRTARTVSATTPPPPSAPASPEVATGAADGPGPQRSQGANAVLDFTAVPEFGEPPDPAALESDLRRMLADRLDVAARLERRARSVQIRPGASVPPPRVTILPDASATATVVEVRAHDRPGLLWRVGQALGECGLQVVAARVDTLGAEAVDVFYVVDAAGRPLGKSAASVRDHVLASLH